jgi:hemolysin activation/secretion protein
MRAVALVVVLTLACSLCAQAAEPQASVAPAATPRILVSGVPAGSPAVQKLIEAAYRQVADANGQPAVQGAAQWQEVVAAVNAALANAGFPGAHAWLSDEVAVFAVEPSGTVAAVLPGAAAAPQGDVLPPVSQREAEAGANQRIAVSGFVVQGVGEHARQGITPASIQQVAVAEYAKLGGTQAKPAQLDFDQLQTVADAITDRYRKAGFIVATAYLPAQTVGADKLVHIDVLEGRIGKVEVQGAKHYYPWVIAAPAEKLRGKALQKDDVDTALLYDRDLPGVSVTSTFQPGEQTGQTDLVMVAREKRALSVTLGLNNYGTDVTGRYRAEANVDWNAPLGIGDKLSAGINYAFDPHQNTYGSLTYFVPTVKVPGLGAVVGAERSELQLNTGPFAALNVRGPTSRWFGGAQWKFVNHPDLSMASSLQYIHEQSSLSSRDFQLSDQRFDVAQLDFSMNHTDRRFHGLDVLSVAVRHALDDNSAPQDLVSPNHAPDFTVAKLGYTRIQFLGRTQQVFFKFAGQYTDDALVPMEQFVIGGPDSVRAYPIADALTDRGFYTSLEYHVDAPGFADKPSPFHGEPWRELLSLEAFLDYAQGSNAAGNRSSNGDNTLTYSGAGVGFIFRLPRWHNLLFRMDGAVPLDGRKTPGKDDLQIYGRFNLTF